MSKYFKYFIAVFIYAGLSCNSPTEPVIINTQTIDTTQLDSLDFQQISYDTVLIKNNNTINLDPEYLRGIYVGSYNNGMFIAQDTVQPVFDGYTLNINYRMSFPDTQLVAKIGVKFVLDDGNEHMVNRTINLYQYPYPSTKILLRWDEFILRSFYYPDIQDFVYLPPKIYYHPTGPYGLYEYNMNSMETRLLYDYSAGDMLGANSKYIIIDHWHSQLYRYVFSKDSVDKEYDIGLDISGIACSDSLVFVAIDNPSRLLTFSTDLKLINSVDINYYIYSMGYYNNYLYGGNLLNDIYKIDPLTGTIVQKETAPDRDVEGIFIYGENHYYSDYTKKYVGYTPIKDIFPN